MNPASPDWLIRTMGDRCVIVEFGQRIDVAINRRVHAFAARLQARAIAGVIDIVPSFTTVALQYRPEAIPLDAHPGLLPYQALSAMLETLLAEGSEDASASTRTVEIPVCYGGEYGPDLEEVARSCKLSTDEVIALHSSSDSLVFMLGFAPGHPYTGMLDERLKLPRRATPRTEVAEGTVAIANGQTVIYPLRLPGGWNLIGRTPLRIFDPLQNPPSLLQPGDRLKFVPITPEQFVAMKEAS